MKKNVTLRGIVVTGDSRSEAVANFVAAAKGENVSAHIDHENGFVILSSAQANDTVFLNPLTGTSSLKPANESVLKQLTFRSESSAEDQNLVNAFYTVCTDCYSHVVADDKELAKHCVVCASDLRDMSEAEIDALQKPETTQPTVGLLAVATDAKQAINKFRDLYEGKTEHKVLDCGNGNMVVACATDDIKFSPHSGKPASAAEDVPYTATASSEGGIGAQLFVCTSDACGVNVVSSNDAPVFCPCCASGLIEPDEEDEDMDEEDEDEEELDDSVATASDDEDDEEEEEDSDEDDESEEDDEDSDESDEDEEEDEGDEDDEEDYDEEDEDDFESDSSTIVVASSTSIVGVEQTASEEDNTATAAGVNMPDPIKTAEEQAAAALAAVANSDGTVATDEGDAASAAQAVQATAEGDATNSDDQAAVAAVASGDAQDGAAVQAAAPAAIAQEPVVTEVIKEVPVHQTVIATDLLELAALAGELNADDLTFVLANNVNRDTRWLAFHKDTPIATASARTTKHPELFGSQAFGTVVAAAAQNDGVREALNDYGFTGIAASVSVDTFVKESVEEQISSQVAEAKAGYEADHKDFADRFKCAASTVARALDINYYKDATHPIKERLNATLNQLGIKNADQMVNAAFASASDEYVELLVQKTTQLMDYNVEVQNQFTEVIASGSQTNNALSFGKPVVVQPQQKTVEPMTSVSNSLDDSKALQTAALNSLRSTTRR